MHAEELRGRGEVRAVGAGLDPPFAHMEWLESKGLKTHNLCLCYSRLLNSNPQL